MTDQQRDEAALAAAELMAERAQRTGHYGHNTGFQSIEEALEAIASGRAVFGDICDDNIFTHQVLSGRRFIPKDSSKVVSSDEYTGIWNRVAGRYRWAAAEILKRRGTLFMVVNETDQIFASPEPMTYYEAQVFMAQFQERFAAQGFYASVAGRIPVEALKLRLEPVEAVEDLE